jgi:hypothetical protein
MSELKDVRQKIGDDRLCQLVDGLGTERISVLIEPDLPSRKVEFSRVERAGVTGYVPTRVAAGSPQEQRHVEERIATTQEFLKEVLGEAPNWIQAARAFVAIVNGEQLQRIARSPLIRAIRPNRRLRA